jgi:hypothetical protein
MGHRFFATPKVLVDLAVERAESSGFPCVSGTIQAAECFFLSSGGCMFSHPHDTPATNPFAFDVSEIPDDAVMSFADWCRRANVSQSTGRRLIAAGRISVTRLSDRRIGVTGREHKRFLNAGTTEIA